MLKIAIPSICTAEQRYALDILLGEFLGLEFDVETHYADFIQIVKQGSESKLSLDASFFHHANHSWLKSQSMPTLPLASWDPLNDGLNVNLVASSIPVLYGRAGLVKNENHFHLNIDIFGSAFFMLSRYEELVTADRDRHERFPSIASVAYKANFLDRPIVNEYLEILWACLQQLWPELERNDRKFRKLISCDVDHPYDLVGYSLKKTIFRVGARVFRDKNLSLAIKDGLNYIYKKFDSDRFDEYRNSINFLIKSNKKAGNKVAFFFIPIRTSDYEDNNDVRSGKIIDLIKQIVENGHEVGIHPGYKTFRHPDAFKQSVIALKQAMKVVGLDSSAIGGRQHYLRYDVAITPQLWQENDLVYDSSLGYADRVGFRCGVCYEYTMYDLTKRTKINLRQRPLIVMDCTIISKDYEGLGITNRAMERIKYFKNVCEMFKGDFTLLWHNSFFLDNRSGSFYEGLINV